MLTAAVCCGGADFNFFLGFDGENEKYCFGVKAARFGSPFAGCAVVGIKFAEKERKVIAVGGRENPDGLAVVFVKFQLQRVDTAHKSEVDGKIDLRAVQRFLMGCTVPVGKGQLSVVTLCVLQRGFDCNSG